MNRTITRARPAQDTPAVQTAPPDAATAGAATEPHAAVPAGRAAAPGPEDAGRADADRRSLIATEAYLRAERRGFLGGSAEQDQDWLDAEAEVDERLQRGA